MSTLSDLVGLDLPVRALRRALAADQLAGTYLFVGPEGVGKTALALAFAAAAACTDPRPEPYDACGSCRSCRLLAASSHPEIALVPPAGDQTQIWQFWNRDGRPPGLVQSTISYSPSVGRRRVYIVERADTLTEGAANSLLKVLEEPPRYACFVLLSPHPSRMLPTVLSRAQVIRLQPMSVADLAQHLVRVANVPEDRARSLAAFADGRVGKALRLVTSKGGMDEVDRVLDLVASIPGSSPLRALKISELMRKLASGLKVMVGNADDGAGDDPAVRSDGADAEDETAPAGKERAGRHQLGAVIDLAAAFYRDVLAVTLLGSGAEIAHVDRREQIEAIAARLSPQACMDSLGILLAARRRVDQNVTIPLLTDWLATRLVLLAK
jgi:DNA polymerase III subunit delta'